MFKKKKESRLNNYFCKDLACLSNPCKNGGTCISYGKSSFYCGCQSNYTGNVCETPVIVNDPCLSRPCLNDGICSSSGQGSFICMCLPGCVGINCGTCNPSNECIDSNTTKCQTYASLGICSANIYIGGIPIKKYCALSCNECT